MRKGSAVKPAFFIGVPLSGTEQHMPSVGQRRGEEVSVASLFQFEAFAESGYGVRKVADGQIGLSEAV